MKLKTKVLTTIASFIMMLSSYADLNALSYCTALEHDSYDWMERHEHICREARALNPEIVFIGDSITHFWAGRWSIGGDDSLPRYKKAFGRWRTLNLGFGWDRTCNVLWRITNGELDGISPRAVVIHIGGNNFTETPQYPGDKPEAVAEANFRIVETVHGKFPSAKIVLMAVSPFGVGPDDWHRAKCRRLNALLEEGATKYDYVKFVDVNPLVTDAQGRYCDQYRIDAVHPSDAGYDRFAELLVPVLEEIAGTGKPPRTGSHVRNRPVPRKALLDRLESDVEVCGLVHWGLNTFTDKEWGYGDEDPSILNPVDFNADRFVSDCKAGGLAGLVFVAKHHDGFCLWPTKTTAHNISRSPFRGGNGDYIREVERACRRAGLKFGIYVSPWDRNHADYGTPAYVDVYHEQIRELLNGSYGEIYQMWFDGANGGDGWYGGAREQRRIPDDYYRYDKLFSLVRGLQPSVCIFYEDDTADLRFSGHENGILPPQSRATGTHFDKKRPYEEYQAWAACGVMDGSVFHPVETDFPLRPGWFYHEKERGRSRHAAYLLKLYLLSVGNGALMNIGLAPDRNFCLDAEDAKALKDFNRLRKAFFANEVTDATNLFNVVVLQENLAKGEQVDGWQFIVDGKCVLSGSSIGRRRIRILDGPISAKNCELRITADAGSLQKTSFKRYFVDFGFVRAIMGARTDSKTTDTERWMTGKAREGE